MRAALTFAAVSLASALQAGTVEVCVRGATGLPAMDGSFLQDPAPDPFVVVTLKGVSDPADECRSVGLLKGEPMRRTARDGSGCCRSTKEQNSRDPAWPGFCCYFPQDAGAPLSLSVWDDDVLTDELIGTAELFTTGGAITLHLRGSNCGDAGSPCAVNVDVKPVFLPSVNRLGPNASAATRIDEPGTVPVGDVEVCVLDVHGHGLPMLDALTAADWAVVRRLSFFPSYFPSFLYVFCICLSWPAGARCSHLCRFGGGGRPLLYSFYLNSSQRSAYGPPGLCR
jgi:hypothetical protein